MDLGGVGGPQLWGPATQTRYAVEIRTLVAWLAAVKDTEPTMQNVTADDNRD